MKEWHVPFHVIEQEWTDDQFYLMIEQYNERIEREIKAQENNRDRDSRPDNSGTTRHTSYTQEQAQQIGAQGLR